MEQDDVFTLEECEHSHECDEISSGYLDKKTIIGPPESHPNIDIPFYKIKDHWTECVFAFSSHSIGKAVLKMIRNCGCKPKENHRGS